MIILSLGNNPPTQNVLRDPDEQSVEMSNAHFDMGNPKIKIKILNGLKMCFERLGDSANKTQKETTQYDVNLRHMQLLHGRAHIHTHAIP